MTATVRKTLLQLLPREKAGYVAAAYFVDGDTCEEVQAVIDALVDDACAAEFSRPRRDKNGCWRSSGRRLEEVARA